MVLMHMVSLPVERPRFSDLEIENIVMGVELSDIHILSLP